MLTKDQIQLAFEKAVGAAADLARAGESGQSEIVAAATGVIAAAIAAGKQLDKANDE
jgi:hypothetical protein